MASVRLARALWTNFEYRRLSFAGAGANIVGTGFGVGIGEVELDLRYWLALDDARAATHAGLLRTRWTPSDAWMLELGVGGCNAAEYSSLAQSAPAGHWLMLGGVQFAPSWRHRLRLDYSLRHEPDARSLARHELVLAWQISL